MQTRLAFTTDRLKLKHRSNRGFTVTDILIGAGLTMTVVSAAGVGMASMIQSSTVANARSERRVELNRSLDFIADEIRQAKDIETNAQSATDPDNFTPIGSNATKVLMLSLPNAADKVVYYVATPPSGSWSGPKVVYRWGPRLNSSGGYDSLGTTSNWTNVALIDKIQEKNSSVADQTSAAATAPGSCNNSGWTVSGNYGFYTCVKGDGSTAEVYQNGRINKVLGGSETLTASSNISTRDTSVSIVNFSPASGATVASLPAVVSPSVSPSTSPSVSPSASPSPVSSPTPTVAPITVTTGQIKAPTTSTMQVRVLGGAITCGAGGPSVPTSAKLYFKGGTVATQSMATAANTTVTKVVAANTTLDITGTSGPYCVSISANSKTSNGVQVFTLLDGQSIPNFKPFDNQKSIGSILGSAATNTLTGKPIVDASTGKVTLAKNQALLLYELGTTNKSSSAFDMQDLVILATLTPS